MKSGEENSRDLWIKLLEEGRGLRLVATKGRVGRGKSGGLGLLISTVQGSTPTKRNAQET
jgi:hypothetical protein